MSLQWLHWAKQIHSTAQAGLAFSKDKFDLERYKQLLELSAEILAEYSNTDMEKIQDLFLLEKGYQTPKVDVRGVVFYKDEILMVKEKIDDLWALPGGFADTGSSLIENVTREIREETGFFASYKRLLAVLDYEKHDHPPQPFHYYKFFIECEVTGQPSIDTLETSDVQFFSLDRLPELSSSRNTYAQVALMFDLYNHPNSPPIID
ncbi:NUDIX hydrolase [Halobacillus massiliensis]|uniref:NUDIX hydrolase n=1 Tax=Halobacillus massiliensis TaxID=1926286 RepID=UPI00117B78D6|nr:NUDIX hydrolase [Halobacillus massiliensis]